MKVQTFRCYGGPLDGLDVTEQYAGEDYLRYNAAGGCETLYKVITIKGEQYNKPVYGKFRNPKCVLIYYPEGKDGSIR